MEPLSKQAEDLRRQAVARFREEIAGAPEALEDLSPDTMLRMLHELQVHQIELAIQNEELGRTRLKLESALKQHVDLYEQAPVGYACLNPQGLILDINPAGSALLGATRAKLIMTPLAGFVAPDSQNAFHIHQQALQVQGEAHSCELRMIRADGTSIWVLLNCATAEDADGSPVCRAVLSDITERHHAQAALEASGDFAASLIHGMHDGFSIVDLMGRALDANPAFCRMTGFSREELIGIRPPHPYWPPEEYSRIQAAFESTLSGDGSNVELVFMRKDGQRFPVIVSAFSVLDQKGQTISFAATVKDITDRKQAEQDIREWNQTLERRVAKRTADLRQSEARFRQLAEATFEGIAITENGVFVDGNHQLGIIYGCDIAALIGRPVIELVAPESRQLVEANVRGAVQTRYEFLGIRDDGARIPLEAHGRMMDWQGRVVRVTALRDLSAYKQAEAELLAHKTELDQALRFALISEVSTGIIHQLSQPLSAIGAKIDAVGYMLESCSSKSCGCPGHFSEISADFARMRDSVIHLKALANPEQPKRLPIDCNGMVLEALSLVRAEAGWRRCDLKTDLAPDQPQLWADRVQLCQALVNLLRNAFDACEDSPPECRSITISTRRPIGDAVEILIRDAGTGFSPENLNRLFSPFFTTKAEGFGVGLRLCQTIIQAHGGTIEGFNNPDGPGATFRITLPLYPAGSDSDC